MFSNGMYSFSSQKMNETCPHCGFKFEIEPGYFYVAMFVSYAFTVAIFTVITGFLYLFIHPEEFVYLVANLAAVALTIPVSFRYSRVLFLYWFGGYRYQGQ